MAENNKRENNNNNNVDDLNELFDDVDNVNTNNNNTPGENYQLVEAFVKAISGITQIASSHTGIKSLALTPYDEKTLTEALLPLAKYLSKMLEILPYLPLLIFTMGYTARVLGEVTQIRKEKRERGELPPKKEKPFWGKRRVEP